MKKALHYFQKQALQYSDDKFNNSAGSLAPRRNHEPQQDIRHRSAAQKHHDHDHDYSDVDATAHGAVGGHARVSPPRSAIPSRISSNIQRIQYDAAHILQSYELYLQPEPSSPDPHSPSSSHGSGANTPLSPGSAAHTPTPRYWVVYIHGGYFRDPSCQASSFHATLARLTDPRTHDARVREMQRHVRGYVSVNYRLARHEAHPQGAETSAYERREATWGEMLGDVLAALRHWQGRYPEVRESGRYLLVGHSVGATLALNAVLMAGKAQGEGGEGLGVTPPRAVLGVNGVYDFLMLHESFPDYESMTENAVPRGMWKEVSPARVERGVWEETWAKELGKEGGGDELHRRKRWLLLAQSRGDGLVDWRQVQSMQRVFEEGDGGRENNILCEVLEIKGRHNECWEDGGELARVVREGLGEVMGVDQ